MLRAPGSASLAHPASRRPEFRAAGGGRAPHRRQLRLPEHAVEALPRTAKGQPGRRRLLGEFQPRAHGAGGLSGRRRRRPNPQADTAKRMHMDSYVLVRPRGSRLDWDGKTFRNLDGRIGFQLGYSVGHFLRAHGVAIDEGSQRSDELAQKLVAGRLAGASAGRPHDRPADARTLCQPARGAAAAAARPGLLPGAVARFRRAPAAAGRASVGRGGAGAHQSRLRQARIAGGGQCALMKRNR
ncbi:hypothetical protein MASSI9I_70174 [Massilia sp. 9I]|nr:hypothetical protein MASSI9I_70174 [Massilia sp. 9I]